MSTNTAYGHLPPPVMPSGPPQQLLLGQQALVTGASSGIGRMSDAPRDRGNARVLREAPMALLSAPAGARASGTPELTAGLIISDAHGHASLIAP